MLTDHGLPWSAMNGSDLFDSGRYRFVCTKGDLFDSGRYKFVCTKGDLRYIC